TTILGPTTNIPFLLRTLSHPAFVLGDYGTDFVSLYEADLLPSSADDSVPMDVHLIPWLYAWYLRESVRVTLRHLPSGWRNVRDKVSMQHDAWMDGRRVVDIGYEFLGGGRDEKGYRFRV